MNKKINKIFSFLMSLSFLAGCSTSSSNNQNINNLPSIEDPSFYENKFNEEFPWVAVSELNENEEEVRRISFDKDKTGICDYNYLTKTKDYNNTEYDIQSLTKAGITYETTPQEYLAYLRLNNIKYNIKEYPEISKDIEIDVIDTNGDILTSTTWIHEENSNKLERICRWEMSGSGRKRFDFYPDETHTMTLRYIN